MSLTDAELPLLRQEPPLSDYTETVRRNVAISWYRTKLPPGALKELHKRSDPKAWFQAGGHLLMLVVLGSFAWYSAGHWSWWITALLVFAYSMAASFLPNAVHELGHGTVFKTRFLNTFFCHVTSFLCWMNHEMFQSSHTRHHRYTLHPPDDLEVVLPVKLIFWHVLKTGIINPAAPIRALRETVRVARGKFKGQWEMTLYPESDPPARKVPIRWARFILFGHLAIIIVAVLTGQWIIPVLTVGHLAIGTWLFFLCNNTQHIGLKDHVGDFRLCCRTFTLNPVVRFMYWQMNYHIEHHMYAAVPCYNLDRLHRMIRHDLPPTPDGLTAVWQQILGILRQQAKDPAYQYNPPLPKAAT